MSSSIRALTPLAVFALALALLAGFGFAYEVPAPYVHDEFAYLLSADTFAHGRLTNPPHPLSFFFETFHVFFEPTYQSKYPPAQGLVLALGEVLWHPILGVWISWAAAIAATCWMLAAILPLGWALVGTALLLFNPYLFLIWGQSYWGGAVAAAGGALLFGALLHARSRASLVDGLALAVGLFLVGNSRPFEGIVTGFFALAMLVFLLRQGWFEGRWPELARRVLVPGALGLLAFLLWTMYYDWRVTGNPFQMPYFTYHPELSLHADIATYTGSPERSFAGKGLRLVDGILGRPLAVAFPFLILKRRDPFVVLAALISYAVGMVVLAGSRAWPHYLAPVTCLIVFLCATSLRGVASLRAGESRVGHAALAFVLVLHCGMWVKAMSDRLRVGPEGSWGSDRREMIAELTARGGKHLVLVRYGPDRDRKNEWVYNEASIDDASVVWARDLGPEKNEQLFAYYPDRTCWMVEVPPYRPLLRPYAPAEPEPASTPGG